MSRYSNHLGFQPHWGEALTFAHHMERQPSNPSWQVSCKSQDILYHQHRATKTSSLHLQLDPIHFTSQNILILNFQLPLVHHQGHTYPNICCPNSHLYRFILSTPTQSPLIPPNYLGGHVFVYQDFLINHQLYCNHFYYPQ